MFPVAAIGYVWPPADIHTFDPFDLPFLMTLILLLSGCTVTWAHHAILEGKQKEVLSPVSKFIQLGLIESSKVTGQSIFLKIKLPAKKEGSPALNSQEPSDAEFSKIEAFVGSQLSIEIDYKEPHTSGKIGFRGNASSKGFESPFLVCSGPAKIEQNKLEK
jgi:hypothetical protein